MKENRILLIYGEGGHRAEMANLLKLISSNCQEENKFIGIYENNDKIKTIEENIEFPIIRDKYSQLQTYKNSIVNFFVILKKLYEINSKYNINLIITTGPGISILPSLFFKLKKAKIVFFENSCKYYYKSLSGKVMSKIADKFYVQNKELLEIYKNAEYCGKLL